jgi:GTP-binding protein Era
VGQKIAAVSPKPQTTRTPIRGIVQDERGQALILDTPGFLNDTRPLERWMRQQIDASLKEADLVLWMVEATGVQQKDFQIRDILQTLAKPALLLINKMDTINKVRAIPLIGELQQWYPFLEIIPMSVKTKDNIDCLKTCLFQHLPEHAPYFDTEILSTQSEREIVAELIREKMYLFTEEEIPYATSVEIELFQEEPLRIEATILVERESQKAIIIGENGRKIHLITQAAQKDISDFLGKPLELKLWVKVVKDWKKRWINS